MVKHVHEAFDLEYVQVALQTQVQHIQTSLVYILDMWPTLATLIVSI